MIEPFRAPVPTADLGGEPIWQTPFHRRGEMPQTHTPPQPSQYHGFSLIHEVGDAICFGARQIQTGGPRRNPPGGKEEKSQQTSCTTVDRNEHGFPPGEAAGRLLGSGYDQSSAEAVTTLGPTRLQDGPASSSAHARAEAMLTCFASVVRLKGALHGASYWDKLHKGARGLWGSSCASGTRRKPVSRLTVSHPRIAT
jgi:hypothetical protein